MYANLETLWQTTIARNPGCAMAYNNLGSTFFKKGQVDEAIVQYQKALAFQPNDTLAHNNLGIALLQKGRADEAIAQFKKVLEIQPRDAEAHYNLANTLLGKGQADEAMAEFQKVLQIQPSNAEAQYNLGWILLQKGQLDEAIAHFQKALEIQPNSAWSHVNLGNILLRKGRVDEAIGHLQTASKLQPTDTRALSSLAWVLATWPEASIRNGVRAVELAQRANQLSAGQDPLILRSLAAAYAECGRFAEAITTARQALSLATAQNNNALVNELGTQIELYQSGSPFRDPRLTAAPGFIPARHD
jgi:Flp pilus assembly protein TadD